MVVGDTDVVAQPVLVAKFDYDGATEEELSFDKGDSFAVLDATDPDWFRVRRLAAANPDAGYEGEPQEGYVPRSYFDTPQEHSAATPAAATKLSAAAKFTRAAQGAVKLRITTQDVLSAMGALPTGFRRGSWVAQQSSTVPTLRQIVWPSLDACGLSFTDFQVDGVTRRLRPVETKHTFAFGLVQAHNISTIGVGCTVRNRYVNVALFERGKLVSNITTLPTANAETVDFSLPAVQFATTWTFQSAPALFPKDDVNACFVRTDISSPDLTLLFELVTVVATAARSTTAGPNTTAVHEVSSGWTVLPLFQPDGTPLEAKVHDLKVHGGSPTERDVALDSAAVITGSATTMTASSPGARLWHSLRKSTMAPRLSVRVWTVSGRVREKLDLLPKRICSLISTVSFLAALRQAIADTVLTGRQQEVNLGVCSAMHLSLPLLRLLDTQDTLKCLSATWEEKQRLARSSDKKSLEMSSARVQDCLTSLWPVATNASLPVYNLHYPDKLQERSLIIKSVWSAGALKAFQGESMATFTPFDIRECAHRVDSV